MVYQGDYFPANRFPFQQQPVSVPRNFWETDVEARLRALPFHRGQSTFAQAANQDFLLQRSFSEFHELADFLDFYEISDLLIKKLPLG